MQKEWKGAEKASHNAIIIVLVLENFTVVTQMSEDAEMSKSAERLK